MMKKAKVLKVSYSERYHRVVITCEDENKETFQATVTKTLCPKVGDTVWVFEDKEDLNYLGHSAVAVLIA